MHQMIPSYSYAFAVYILTYSESISKKLHNYIIRVLQQITSHSEAVRTVAGVSVDVVLTDAAVETGSRSTLIMLIFTVTAKEPGKTGAVIGVEEILWERGERRGRGRRKEDLCVCSFFCGCI